MRLTSPWLLQEAHPSRQTYSYSFRETSSASRGIVTKRVAKTDFASDDYDGRPAQLLFPVTCTLEAYCL